MIDMAVAPKTLLNCLPSQHNWPNTWNWQRHCHHQMFVFLAFEFVFKTSQELRMLSRSLSDCKPLLLNLDLNLNRCLCLCSDCSDFTLLCSTLLCSALLFIKSDSLTHWLTDSLTDWQCHLLSCPGQLKTHSPEKPSAAQYNPLQPSSF